MRHVRSLDFEALEMRQLLTKVHPAAAAVALVLNGTLTVDSKAASTAMNEDGGTTTSTPVAGTLAGLGKVRGLWDESVDAYGDYEGPDTIQLHDSQGTFVVAFSTANPGKAHPIAHGAVFHELAQRVHGGTGAYVKASESGTIDLNTNTARTSVISVTLNTSNS